MLFYSQKRLGAQDERKKELTSFWKRLLKIKKLSLIAKSRQEQRAIKTGKADIIVSMSAPCILIFQEKGYWFTDQHPDTNFSNVFRWTLDLQASLITLEHLRYGTSRPVFLSLTA